MKIFEALEQDRRWTEDERLLLDQVDRLTAEVIAPNAAEVDATSAFPWDNVKAINELGLNAIFVPEAYGGAPMSFRLYLAVVRRIAEACASTGIIYATNFHAMKPLIEFGSEKQKARLLPCIAEGGLAALAITEETAGSDATGMKTRFRPDGDDIVIDGAKIFITNGDVADRILLFGKHAEIDDPRRAISVLVVEKGAPGLEVVGLEKKMGYRGSSTAALRFDGCRVRREPDRAAGRRACHSARVAQSVTSEHCRARHRHCDRGVQGHDGVYERAPAVRPPDHRLSGQPVSAGRSGHRSRDGRALARSSGRPDRRRRAGLRR